MIEAPSRPRSAPPGEPPAPNKRPRQFPRWLYGLGVTALIVAVFAAGLRWAYGGFQKYYLVSLDLPRAGQQLDLGSDVRINGVNIGTMVDKQLVTSPTWHVHMTLQIQNKYRVPADAQAVVTLKTLLGAKVIELRFPRYAGPFLQNGDRIRAARIGPELEDALADGVRVLQAIPPDDLATVVHELAIGARGHGRDVARGLKAQSQLAELFARTLPPQVKALHDFRTIFGALRDRGVDLNLLADAMNEGVPVYASPEAQRNLRNALEAVVPFANNLGDLLIVNRRDWDRMIAAGDVVLGTLASRPQGVRSLVSGLNNYVHKLGGDPCNRFFSQPGNGITGTTPDQQMECAPINDGSASAGFVNFISDQAGNGTNPFAEFCANVPSGTPLDPIRNALGCTP
ncbi:MAG TPA: MlaD family protein [Actinomycetota bacterium]|jgi:phospholipid/cholesterol/gamma-HCH transport system substrate-binding protein